MSDLGVKHVLARHVELVDQSSMVFTEVVEDFEDCIGTHDFFESELERIKVDQIKEIALIIEEQL